MAQSSTVATVAAGSRTSAVFWLLLLAVTFILCCEFVGVGAACASGTTLVLSWWLVRKTTELFNFRRVTITGFWYLTYLAMIFLPAFFVFSDEEGPYRARYLFAVHSALITVPAGWLLAKWFCRFHNGENERYFIGNLVDTSQRKRTRLAYWVLLILSLMLMILYIRSVGTIPLFFLLKNPGDYMQIALLREDSFKLLNSPYVYGFALARSVFFPLLVMVSFGFYIQTRSKMWRNLFIGTVAAAVFYCSLSVAKAPVAAIVAMLGFFYYYYRRGVIGRKALAVFLIAILLFPLAVTWLAYAGVATKGAFYAIGARLFYVPSQVVYYYFEVFPHWHGFLYGGSIDKFARLMGWVPFNTANYVGVYAIPDGLESVSANAAFIADLYADFGMPGVLLGGVVAGFVMQWFHIHAIRQQKTIVAIALYSFLTYTFWFLNSNSLPIVLASDGAILALMLSWWFDREVSSIKRRIGIRDLNRLNQHA